MTIDLGLSRIARLVKHIPLKWNAIHVAGTNGKGSITAYISAILREAGVRTGRFNSPHLIDRWDCISIQDRPVSSTSFLRVEDKIKAFNDKHGIHASEFELLTSVAFEIFNQARVDVGVVEVGLGGRLDATNILGDKDVLVSVISKIGLDHQALLGSSLTAIAREKAGIMREGVPCIVDGTNDPVAMDVISDQAIIAKTEVARVTVDAQPETVKLLQPHVQQLNLAPHQLANLLVAVNAAQMAGPRLNLLKPIEKSLNAVSTVHWPGRLQHVSLEPVLGHNLTALLDGAHNPQAANALATYVDQNLRQDSKPVTWILAASEGKDLVELVRSMVRPHDTVIATEFGPVDGMPWVRAVCSRQIVHAARSACNVDLALETTNPGPALWNLLDLDLSGVVIAGSLYLVSDVLRLLRSKRNDVTNTEDESSDESFHSSMENGKEAS